MGATSFPKSKIEIALFERIHAAGASRLRQERFAVETSEKAATDGQLRSVLASAHGIGVRSRTQVTARRLRDARRLLVVGCFCVGTNNVDLDAATAAGVPVFHAPHASTRSVAELTIGLILSLSRKMVSKGNRVRKGQWDKGADGCLEVRGKTLGLVGYGHIGSQVSVLAESLGMRVVFHDIADRQPMGNAQPLMALSDLLREADFVSLHVPGGSGTRHLIAGRELRAMRKGAFLINTSRGTVIDEQALVRSLREKRLGGVALDVLEQEPRTPGARVRSPLLGFEEVVLTPHIGGSTAEAQRRIAESVAGKMIRFINQGSTQGSVNFPHVALPRIPGTHRIIHIHRNVPGVLTAVNRSLSQLGANVEAQYLKTNELIGYLVVDIDRTISARAMAVVDDLPETIRTRRLF